MCLFQMSPVKVLDLRFMRAFFFIFKGLIKAENFPQNIKIYGGISNLISSLMGSRFNLSVTTSGYIKTKVFPQLHSEVVQVSRFSK